MTADHTVDPYAGLYSRVQYHNGICEASCDIRRDDGHCEPYLSRKKTCPDCPRDWLIDVGDMPAPLGVRDPREGK